MSKTLDFPIVGSLCLITSDGSYHVLDASTGITCEQRPRHSMKGKICLILDCASTKVRSCWDSSSNSYDICMLVDDHVETVTHTMNFRTWLKAL